MKERPILFSAPMVRALLSGAKTQTRRICKPANEANLFFVVDCGDPETDFGPEWWGDEEGEVRFRCPYGKPGDRLWVRETWAPCEAPIRAGCFQFAADGAVGQLVSTNGGDEWWERNGHTIGISDSALLGVWVGQPSKWRPSIHMPRRVSRITLEITDVRVERLQDISEADAIAEGARRFDDIPVGSAISSRARWSMEEPPNTDHCLSTARFAFANYFNKVGGPGSWDANPWVWALTFRRVVP